MCKQKIVQYALGGLFFVSSLSGQSFRPPTEEELARLPLWRQQSPEQWLLPDNHPRLLPPGTLERIRDSASRSPWAASYMESLKKEVTPLMAMSEEELRALVPEAGSLYVLGLSYNLDPVEGKPLKWGGWEAPFHMLDSRGNQYPNDAWPDEGKGYHPEGGEPFYFVARANMVRMRALESEMLPALADLYAFTGDMRYAEVAASLLDEIAAVYGKSNRGPIDYPVPSNMHAYGGKLDRPTQQVARGLVNYVQVVDLVASSGVLAHPSTAVPGGTIGENIARNLVWDGGIYCLTISHILFGLSNGVADLSMGAASAGVILGNYLFMEPLLEGENNFYWMLSNNLNRQEFYFETSPGYEFFTLDLYARIAEFLDAVRLNLKGWEITPIYDNPGMLRALYGQYSRRQLSGHVPLLGNTRTDIETVVPGQFFPTGNSYQNQFRMQQLSHAWMILRNTQDPVWKERAGQLLKRIYEQREVVPPASRWSAFFLSQEEVDYVKGLPELQDDSFAQSVFYGGRGLALLRGGRGNQEHGAQLLYGPAQIKSQYEGLTWTFYSHGIEWSFDPGRFNAHFRFGWSASSVAHQSMVVDRTNIGGATGAGELNGWYSSSNTQWARANHPHAYREKGVERFERLIGQRQSQEGELLYWLDLSLVSGGEVREDSFHTQMREAVFPDEIQPRHRESGSLSAEGNWHELLRPDYFLEGKGRGFYWTPPGEGYGFLARPAWYENRDGIRVLLRSPAFARQPFTLAVDFPGLEGRDLILAMGPSAPNHPSVPYLIRSDANEKTGFLSSVFAKVIRVIEPQGEDPVVRVQQVRLEGGESKSLASAWWVELRDGTADLWIVNDAGRVSMNLPNGEKLTTDAETLLLRYDVQGVMEIHADRVGVLTVDDAVHLRESPQCLQGRVGKVSAGDTLDLEVQWEIAPPRRHSRQEVSALVSIGETGQRTSWTLQELQDNKLTLAEVTNSVGRSMAVGAGRQRLELRQFISRFTSVSRDMNDLWAVGRPVYADQRMIGRIQSITEDARIVELDRSWGSGKGEFLIEITEFAEGDVIKLPLQYFWQRE